LGSRYQIDRLLIATAISEKMYLVTADANIQKYPVHCIWQCIFWGGEAYTVLMLKRPHFLICHSIY
jgi:hypothetical protein